MTARLPQVPANIASLEPYRSARFATKGDGWTFLDAGENPLGPPALSRYPDPTADALRDDIAQRYALERANVFVGCGIDEILELCVRTFVRPDRSVVALEPSFPLYRFCAQVNGRAFQSVPLLADFAIDLDTILTALKTADLVFIARPNNPTGTVVDLRAIETILSEFSGLVVLDEAYGEFLEATGGVSGMRFIGEGVQNLFVTRTLSKAFGAAGIRLGYGLAADGVINQLLKTKLPYNVNVLTQNAGCELFAQWEQMEKRVRSLQTECQRLQAACRALGCTVADSVTHFFLLQLPAEIDGQRVYERLRDDYRIVVRPFGMIGGRASLRVSTGTPEQNDRFVEALTNILNS